MGHSNINTEIWLSICCHLLWDFSWTPRTFDEESPRAFHTCSPPSSNTLVSVTAKLHMDGGLLVNVTRILVENITLPGLRTSVTFSLSCARYIVEKFGTITLHQKHKLQTQTAWGSNPTKKRTVISWEKKEEISRVSLERKSIEEFRVMTFSRAELQESSISCRRYNVHLFLWGLVIDDYFLLRNLLLRIVAQISVGACNWQVFL